MMPVRFLSRKHLILQILLTELLLSMSTGASAVWVQAKGSAVITDSGTSKARQLAVQDAMRQATLQAGAQVQSSTQISESVLQSDSVRVRATGKVSDVVVIDEWADNENELYVVLIRANVEAQAPAQSEHRSMRYRRKVAVTQLQVSDRRQIHDLPNIEVELAKEVMRRMQLNENLFAIDATDYLLPESMEHFTGMGNSTGNIVVDLASRLGVQFIVTGTIRDLGVTKHPLWVQLRHAEIEILVLDGVSGALVSQHRSNGSVVEDRWFDFPTTTPTMNDKFYATPIGYEVHNMINGLVAQVAADMRQIPFTARVIQARGKRVQFDAGATSQLKVGDVLMAYQVAKDPVMNAMGQDFLGFDETPGSALVVKKVLPQFAIGELESESTSLQSGDVLRFNW